MYECLQVLERVTPGQNEEEETPNAEALFNDWTGVKMDEVDGDSSGAVPPKEERLL